MRRWLIGVVVLGVAGCAVRLGGPTPIEYNAVALEVAAGTPAANVASALRAAAVDVVLITAPRDSSWFAELAESLELDLSGPGLIADGGNMAFLTSLEILGDTTITLPTTGGGQLHMHDALYEVDEQRHLDLMLVRMTPGIDLRAAMQTLLGYIATDVGATAAVLLALDMPTPQLADSATVLLRAYMAPARGCADDAADAAAPAGASALRLFYGPSARIDCESAQPLPELGAVVTRVVINR
jgi:hypothetical protein